MNQSLLNELYGHGDVHPLARPGELRSLDAIAGEVVGARLMHKLGIGAPSDIRVAHETEIRDYDPRQWIIKPVSLDGRAKVGTPAIWNLAIKKIPRTISVRSLRELYGIAGPEPEWNFEGDIATEEQRLYRVGAIIGRSILHYGTQKLADPKAFFADFVPPSDWSQIRAAIRWDSPERLRIGAARLLLGCSAGHAGNILVDRDGRLFSIDHEYCTATDFSELRVLAENVKPGTAARSALVSVAEAISESDVEAFFDDLPAGITWPLGSLEITLAYFQLRLTYWKAFIGAN